MILPWYWIPEKVMWDAKERMVTTEENMNRPLHENESPDVYDNYDTYTEGFDGTSAESRDWWD